MSLDEETLETAANGGLIDFDKWPAIVEPLIERLEHTVYHVFTMPPAQPQPAHQLPSSDPSASFAQDPNPVPSSSNKENASPADLDTPQQPATATTSSNEAAQDPQPQSSEGGANGPLPASLQLLLDSVKSTLRSLFTSKPPHTIQRLAELILRPNAHYKTLPAYLRAVDRVVCVTSSADIFPLQAPTSTSLPNGVVNGAESGFLLPDHALGSDESLGGALLTPIPWLNNAASPEAEIGAVESEGHLDSVLTTAQPQQTPQQEVEDPSAAQQPTLPSQSGTGVLENQPMEGTGSPQPESSEDVPHARGPRVVGVEDMGLQDGRGVEMTLPTDDDSTKRQDDETKPAQEGETNETPAKEKADDDGDIVLGDVKATEEETSTTASAPAPSDQDEQAKS